MSSDQDALLSATFHDGGYEHLVELVHQRDREAHRRLASVRLDAYDEGGVARVATELEPDREILDLDALLGEAAGAHGRLLVVFDARYDRRVFPYRPHHYAYLHRRGSRRAPLYYAINATLGGVPDRIGAVALNNFETYLFLARPLPQRHGVLLANVSRFAPAEAQVMTYYDGDRETVAVRLDPKQHVEVALAPDAGGRRLSRVDVKAAFRLTSYVTGRVSGTDELVLFDHLFTYFK